ncbi:FG-GAP-like repeat-containing protein [Dictyobacter kobayashii]|uniref:VCBS repeat-containing protein n=1 Tax=Dictyobacter kobayashii TaxID=2014872 RepID=A0A402ANM7_9CHLR|nr:FG-GAP-like repeat-containing protein [Dictyobacter kobayashii]GCE20629.1 hypothetical protein KDK_44290 [Dictyobacter kobayashii]
MFHTKRISIIMLILIGFGLCGIGVMPLLFSKHGHMAYALASTYAPPVNYAVGNVPFGVVAGNFTGHGSQDIAVANNYDSTVSILENNGHGVFTEQIAHIPTGDNGNPVGIVAGNFMGNGYQDLAVTNIGDASVGILANDGNGNFTLQPLISVDFQTYGIAAGDFFGHGYQDLAVTNQGDGMVTVLENNGHGTFTPHTPIAVGSAPEGL